MEFQVARAARPTGEMLERLVREALAADHITEPDCVVCYGAGYSGTKPSLNALCSTLNKMQQGTQLRSVLGLEALNVKPLADTLRLLKHNRNIRPAVTLIARKVKHAKGKDMLVCDTVRKLE